MNIIYLISSYLGYFLVMIAFMVIAILIAKHKASWLVYVAGAGIQLLSLIGNQMTANMLGISIAPRWIIYIVLLIVAALIIDKRQKNYMNK